MRRDPGQEVVRMEAREAGGVKATEKDGLAN